MSYAPKPLTAFKVFHHRAQEFTKQNQGELGIKPAGCES